MIQAHRYTTAGAECSHSPQIFISGLEWDDQDGGISVTQIIACVHESNSPPLIRQTLGNAEIISVIRALECNNIITCAYCKPK